MKYPIFRNCLYGKMVIHVFVLYLSVALTKLFNCMTITIFLLQRVWKTLLLVSACTYTFMLNAQYTQFRFAIHTQTRVYTSYFFQKQTCPTCFFIN